MSVLIKDMQMPKSCGSCKLFGASHAIGLFSPLGWCRVNGKEIFRLSEKADFCPIVEVPEPHGRLIDADALHKLFEDQWHYLQVLDWNENPTAEAKQSGINWCINTMHDDAPTIIPASEEG